MASLALAAAVVILFVWGVAGVSLIFTFSGFRLAGAVFGAVSVAAGAWLLCVLPHVPFLGMVNLVAGAVAVSRYFNGRE